MSNPIGRGISVIIDDSRSLNKKTASEVLAAREVDITHTNSNYEHEIYYGNNREVFAGGYTIRGKSGLVGTYPPNRTSEDNLPNTNLQYSRDEILGEWRRDNDSFPNSGPSEESQTSVTIPCGSTTMSSERESNHPDSRESEKDATKLRGLQEQSSRRSAAKTSQGIPTIPAVCRDMVGHCSARPMADILLERYP